MLLTAINSLKLAAFLVPFSIAAFVLLRLSQSGDSLGLILTDTPIVAGWAALGSIAISVMWSFLMRQLGRLA